MARLTLTLLGGFQARTDAIGPLPLSVRKVQALLAYLALPPGRAHPRDKLAALLWGDVPEPQARTSLRQALSMLKRGLGDAADALRADGATVSLDAAPADVDALAFEREATAGTPETLARAVALYRGDLLAGLAVSEPFFEEWLMAERERLRELALEALARLLAHQRASGATGPAVQTGVRLLALDPLQEPAHRTLMRLYAQLGRRDAALRQYQHCVDVLQRELGIEPEADTKALYQEILRQRPGRMVAAPLRGPTGPAEPPLVGRDSEVARLHEALAAAWSGQGRIVAVLGETGIGKSRLLAELAAEARRRDGSILVGRAYESEQILPFGPWVDAFREAGVLADPRSLEGLGGAWLAELARLFPELVDAGQPPAAEPRDHLRLFEALARLLRHLALPQPWLVVLEDIHSADDMSLRFLAFLGRRLHEAPILVAVSVQEELADSPVLRHTLDELAAEQRLVRLTLGRLGRDDTLALVRLLGRVDSHAAAMAQRGEQVWEASAGNPFIVVETMRAIEEGVTVGASAGLPFPTRVRDMITRRLDRLGPRGRQLLSAAAVIGHEFEFVLLQGAARLTDHDTAEGVEELVRRRVLHSTGPRFDFTHDRIREIAYLALLPPHRRELHGSVAQALEALYGTELESHYGVLAAHYREAGAWDKAVEYLARFAESAARRYAHGEAAAALDEALRYAERLPDARRDRRILELVLQQARLFRYLGRLPDLVARLRREQARLVRVGEPSLTGPYYFLLGAAHSVLGERERAHDAARRAIEEARRCDDRPTMGEAYAVLTREAHWLGRPLEALRHGRRAVRLLQKTDEARSLGMAHWLVGRPYYHMGEFEAALASEERARAIGESIGDLRLQSHVAWTTGELLAVRGDWEAGIALCTRALEISPDPLDRANALGHLGSACLEAGEAGRAIPLLEQAARQFGEFHGGQARGWYTMLLGAAQLAKGDLDQARVQTLAGLEILEAARYRRGLAWGRRTLGRLAQRTGALGEAEAHLREALAIFAEVSARFETARTHLALAELAHLCRDASGARRHLDDAYRLFCRLAVPRYVEQAERMAAELGVPLSKAATAPARARKRRPGQPDAS